MGTILFNYLFLVLFSWYSTSLIIQTLWTLSPIHNTHIFQKSFYIKTIYMFFEVHAKLQPDNNNTLSQQKLIDHLLRKKNGNTIRSQINESYYSYFIFTTMQQYYYMKATSFKCLWLFFILMVTKTHPTIIQVPLILSP